MWLAVKAGALHGQYYFGQNFQETNNSHPHDLLS